uniref:Uncharacterized protein n=1 Tax=Rhizophora mucronata TaxID=61149 RepID=A0A2P2MEJ7_RHIMU
MKRVQICRE